MRKVLLSVLALCSMGVTSAQMKDGVQARVYAYDLQQTETTKVVNEGTIASYVVTFKTNTAATSAVVSLKNANGVVSSVEATSSDNKNWTAEVDVTTLGADIVAGTYNWEVTVSGNPVESFTELANPYTPYRSFGLTVNTNPESDYFGTAYMAHQATKSGRMANGIFMKAKSKKSAPMNGIKIPKILKKLSSARTEPFTDLWSKAKTAGKNFISMLFTPFFTEKTAKTEQCRAFSKLPESPMSAAKFLLPQFAWIRKSAIPFLKTQAFPR